jgi:parallel beta-helix repeat protein
MKSITKSALFLTLLSFYLFAYNAQSHAQLSATKYIRDDATGGDCASIGTWNSVSKTCTLGVDLAFDTANGIQIDSDGITLDGNRHTITGNATAVGIYLADRTGVTIKNLNAKNFSEGISLNSSQANFLNNNTVISSFYGIALYHSSANSLADNSVNQNGYSGILLYASTGNTVTDNIANLNSYYGILLDYSGSNTLSGNITDSNDSYGMLLGFNCTNNVLKDNRLSNNKRFGLYIYEGSSTNQVYHNNFIGNYAQSNYAQAEVWGAIDNSFDNGYPYGGNYWSDYVGLDLNNGPNQSQPGPDGIGDTPYVFNGGSDKYPLMKEVVLMSAPTITIPGFVGNQAFTAGNLNYYEFTLVKPSSIAIISTGSMDLKGTLYQLQPNGDKSFAPDLDHLDHISRSYNDITYTGNPQDNTGVHSNFMIRPGDWKDYDIPWTEPCGGAKPITAPQYRQLPAGTYYLAVEPDDGASSSGTYGILVLKRPSSRDEFLEGLQLLVEEDGDPSNDYLDIYFQALYPELYDNESAYTTRNNWAGNTEDYKGISWARQCKALVNVYQMYVLGECPLQQDGSIHSGFSSNDPGSVFRCGGTIVFNNATNPDYGNINDAQEGDIFIRKLSNINHYGLYLDKNRSIIDANWRNDGRIRIGVDTENLCSEKSPCIRYNESTWKIGRATSHGTITVTSPNGGESWAIGSTQMIGWTSDNVCGNVKIDVSKNGGVWTRIVSSTANDGSYAWKVPGPATQARMRVSSVQDSSIAGFNDGNFTIGGCIITIASPNGGEAWPIGSTQTVHWASSGCAGNVKLQLSRDGGGSWTNMIGSTADVGAYDWKVTKPLTTHAKIQVTNVNDSTGADTSEAEFTIGGGTITVGSPSGGAVWPIGSTQTIRWTSSWVGGNVKIELSRNGGKNWTTIVGSTANNGGYNWKVTAPATAQAQIRVSNASDSSVADTSDSNFNIQ